MVSPIVLEKRCVKIAASLKVTSDERLSFISRIGFLPLLLRLFLGCLILTMTLLLIIRSRRDLHPQDILLVWVERGIREYIQCCHTCRRHKYKTFVHVGLLQTLHIPNCIWEDLSIYFIEGTVCGKYILVIKIWSGPSD